MNSVMYLLTALATVVVVYIGVGIGCAIAAGRRCVRGSKHFEISGVEIQYAIATWPRWGFRGASVIPGSVVKDA